MRHRAFKFRLYPDRRQAEMLNKHFGCCRWVYNWGLERKQAAYQRGEKLSCIDIANMLPDLKKQNPWLKEVNSQSLQSSIRNLGRAFERFFAKQAGFPGFKKKGRKDSFQAFQNCRVDLEGNRLDIPKCLGIRMVAHRKFEGKIKSITVSKAPTGKFHASILVETAEEDKPTKPIDPRTTIGIDVGLKCFAVLSTGEKVENPRFMRKAKAKIRILQRRMARRKKGGKNRAKARRRLALAHERIASQRGDFLYKLTRRLTNDDQVGTICVEDLNVKGMMRNHHLAGAIQDASWGEFMRLLECKCRWNGVNLVRIGRFDPSSKLCSCGRRNDELTLADREWTCPACGARHDRDLLAAQNIRTFGLARAESLGRAEEKVGGGTRRRKLGELPGRDTGASNQEAAPL